MGFEDEEAADAPIAGELRELALALPEATAAALSEAIGAMAQTNSGPRISEGHGGVVESRRRRRCRSIWTGRRRPNRLI